MAKRKRISTQNRKRARPKCTAQPRDPLVQEESPFFRLPAEVRLIIYKEIFIAPTTIHLSWVDGRYCRFRSFQCKLPEEEQYEKTRSGDLCDKCRADHFECHPRQPWPNTSAVRRRANRPSRRTRVTSMLRSCMRVYYETIDMLYQQNTFYIEHPYTLTELCKYMPQERLSSFRTLSLEFAIARFQPLPLPERRDIVRALKMLDGLECLCLIMRLPCDVVTQMRPLERLIKRATARGCFAVAPRLLWAPILGVMGKREKSVKECPLHGIHLSDPKAIELGSFCE